MTVLPETSEGRAVVDQAIDRLLADHDPKGDVIEFLGARFDAGLAWVWYPKGLGGLGLSRGLQGIV